MLKLLNKKVRHWESFHKNLNKIIEQLTYTKSTVDWRCVEIRTPIMKITKGWRFDDTQIGKVLKLYDDFYEKNLSIKKVGNDNKNSKLQYCQNLVQHVVSCIFYLKNKRLKGLTDGIVSIKCMIKSNNVILWKSQFFEKLYFHVKNFVLPVLKVYQIKLSLFDAARQSQQEVANSKIESILNKLVNVKQYWGGDEFWSCNLAYDCWVYNVDSKILRDKINSREEVIKFAEDLNSSWEKYKNENINIKNYEQFKSRADEACDSLIEDGILAAVDKEYGKVANSGNFVKSYICYLISKYPNLKEIVEILYCPVQLIEKQPTSWNKECDCKATLIAKLTEQTINTKKILFIISQIWVMSESNTVEGYGHAHINICCNGKQFAIDTSPQGYFGLITAMDTSTCNSGQGLQSGKDTGNCVAMSLGGIESFLKKLSKMVNKTSEYENLSEWFATYLRMFFDAKVKIDIYLRNKTYDLEEVALLPPQFLKYLQSTTKIEQFLDYAERFDPKDTNYAVVNKVAKKLQKVQDRHIVETKDEKGSVRKINNRANDKRMMEILKIKHFSDELKAVGNNLKNEIQNVTVLDRKPGDSANSN